MILFTSLRFRTLTGRSVLVESIANGEVKQFCKDIRWYRKHGQYPFVRSYRLTL